MKNKLFAWLGTGALALSLAILPSTLPASAQTVADPIAPTDTATNGDTLNNGTNGDRVTTDDNNRDDNGFDWGWLGLLGLVGLAGLKGRDRDYDTRTNYVAPTTTTSANNPRY